MGITLLHANPETKFTNFGKWATLISLFFVFSISADYRLSLAGLLVHPYLIVLPVAIFFSGMTFKFSPYSVLYSLLLFYVFFCIGSMQNINPFSEIIKVGASLFTFLFYVQAVRSPKDFRMVSWGFLVVALTIGIMGFFIGEDAGIGERLAGINALEGIGNKNAQSLYTLPGLFLSIFLVLYYLKEKKYFLVGILLLSIFIITIQIFLSANRSGWLGLIIVFISYLAFYGIHVRTLLLSCILALFGYVAVVTYADDIFERKRTQTLEGYGSDVGRQTLIQESLIVGLENPLFGVGFDNLATELAKRLGVNRFGIYRMDAHFLFGYLLGATGIFSLFFFLLFLWQVCKKRIRKKIIPRSVRQAWILLVSFVVLFVIRSLFSREILYSPTFIGGIGLVFGYYLMQLRYIKTIR